MKVDGREEDGKQCPLDRYKKGRTNTRSSPESTSYSLEEVEYIRQN